MGQFHNESLRQSDPRVSYKLKQVSIFAEFSNNKTERIRIVNIKNTNDVVRLQFLLTFNLIS